MQVSFSKYDIPFNFTDPVKYTHQLWLFCTAHIQYQALKEAIIKYESQDPDPDWRVVNCFGATPNTPSSIVLSLNDHENQPEVWLKSTVQRFLRNASRFDLEVKYVFGGNEISAQVDPHPVRFKLMKINNEKAEQVEEGLASSFAD